MQTPVLPAFVKDSLEQVAYIQVLAKEYSPYVHLTGVLRDFTDISFSIIIQCVENVRLEQAIDALESLPVITTEMQQYSSELVEAYGLKSPLFLWVCCTDLEEIYYYHISRNCLLEWSEKMQDSFAVWLSVRNKLNPYLMHTFVQEILLTTLDNGKFANKLTGYKTTFPVLFDQPDKIETWVECFRIGEVYYSKQEILTAYPTQRDVPERLLQELLQVFINHSDAFVKKSILELFIFYDFREVIPHLLKSVERYFALDNHRIFHGYGYHLEKVIHDDHIDPFLEALVIFQVKEPWVYPRLRHLLSYNHARLTEKIALVAFLLELPETHTDFETGVLSINREFIRLNSFDLELVQPKLLQLFQQTSNLDIQRSLLTYLGTQTTTYQTIVQFALHSDGILQKQGIELIQRYFNYLPEVISEEHADIVAAYEKALGMTIHQYQESKAENRQQWLTVSLENFLEAYEQNDFIRVKKIPALALNVANNPVFVSVFRDALSRSHDSELHTYVTKEILGAWVLLSRKYQEENTKDRTMKRSLGYNISSLFPEILQEINQPRIKEYEYIKYFIDFAYSYNLSLPGELLINTYRQGMLSLSYLHGLIESVTFAEFMDEYLTSDLSSDEFLYVLNFLKTNQLVLPYAKAIEQKFLDLLNNPLHAFQLPFLDAVQEFATPAIADAFWRIQKYHTWDVPGERMDSTYTLDYLQYHLRILAKAQYPHCKDYFLALLTRENIDKDYNTDKYKRYIYQLLVEFFGEEGESFLLQKAAQGDFLEKRYIQETLEVDKYYRSFATG